MEGDSVSACQLQNLNKQAHPHVLVVKAYDTEWNKIHDVDMEISKHKKTKIRKMVKYWGKKIQGNNSVGIYYYIGKS